MLTSDRKTQDTHPHLELREPPHEQLGGLPAVVEQPPRPRRTWRPRIAVMSLLVLVGTGAGLGRLWWQHPLTAAAGRHRLWERPPRRPMRPTLTRSSRPHLEALRRRRRHRDGR